MSRETENVLLFLVGVSLAMTTVVGTYTRYVKPSLLPWLLAAAVLLIVLAISAAIRDVRRGRHGEQSVGHDHAHSHAAGIVWLLAVPVAVMIFVVPPALGAHSAGTSSVTPVSAGNVLRHAFAPLPAERAPSVPMSEVIKRLSYDTAGTLTGRLITVVGFTMTSGDKMDVARFYVICCAADARLKRMHLIGPATTDAYPDNTWLSVEGTLIPEAPDSTGRRIPSFAVSSMKVIDAPADPYNYP